MPTITQALDEQMQTLCTNAKAANILVMTVSLDLDETQDGEKKAIAALKACASDSRFRKERDDKPAKLFWNATGATLATEFQGNRRRTLQPAHRQLNDRHS